jgi:F-type H+-transporting ATPase subunit epsilon
MADKLHFSLVSPEREVFAGEVDQVVAPGVEGDFGVLAGHAPFMTVLKVGEVVVLNGAERRVFEIQGGFADVTPAGLTILAEQAIEYGAGVHDGARQPDGAGKPH